MCGINGVSWEDETLLQLMNSSISHRGPDDQGVSVVKGISLGAVRLSIIDLSYDGHQPMTYERNGRKLWIAYNGEIYNFKCIRAVLEASGYTFRSKSDTEVILAAYLEWGYDCVKKFNGMWAFAIFDEIHGILFLSRDRFGIKPLYYYWDNQKLIFSSEIRAILSCGLARRPNDKIIYDYLFFGVADHTEDTFFDQVKRLMPAHNLVYEISTKSIRAWKYFDLAEELDDNSSSVETDFKQIFLESVSRHLISDVPVGSCLSGGLDSSAIVCAMRQLQASAEIKTFSLVFPGEKIDESRYQRIVVDSCDASAYSTSLTDSELLDDLEQLITTQEEPFMGLSPYGQFRIMKLAKDKGMKVLLDGQGSDELLAGYHMYFGYYYYELLAKFHILSLIKELFSYRRKYRSYVAWRYFIGLLLPRKLQLLIMVKGKSYLNRSFAKRFSGRIDTRFKRKSLERALLESLTTYSVPYLLRLEDKNSMHWSVESRVPFLDVEFVKYCFRNCKAKMKDSTTKIPLRRGLQDLVPPDVLSRQDKIGFATPDKKMAASEKSRQFILDLLESESFTKRGYWNAEKVKKFYVRSVLENKGSQRFANEEFWRLILLELWLRVWIDCDLKTVRNVGPTQNSLGILTSPTSRIRETMK